MACILKPECKLMHGYFRCLLLEETGDVEMKVKMMRGTHTFRRNHTSQFISCKLWSPRLHPYPSRIKKMQTYLELEGKHGNQPHTITYQLGKSTSLWRTPVPKKAADKKRRTKTPITRWFKVRLVEKSLPVDPEPEAFATRVTWHKLQWWSQQPLPPNPAQYTIVYNIVYYLAQSKIQEIPNPTRKSRKRKAHPP